MIYVRLLIIYNIMKLFLRTLYPGISKIDDKNCEEQEQDQEMG